MTTIEQAIEAILATYGDPQRVAAAYKIDNAEIQAAMKEAESGSGQHYALTLLAKANPPKPVKAKD